MYFQRGFFFFAQKPRDLTSLEDIQLVLWTPVRESSVDIYLT